MCHSWLESSHRDESNGGWFVFLRSLDSQIFDKMTKIGIFAFTILRHLTFCRISRHPMIVERCIIARSIRLDETILMSYSASFHDHWMPRYSTKRQMAQYCKCKRCRFLTFCGISRHPSIVESWNSYHSIRLDETIPMSYSRTSPTYNKGHRKKLALY